MDTFDFRKETGMSNRFRRWQMAAEQDIADRKMVPIGTYKRNPAENGKILEAGLSGIRIWEEMKSCISARLVSTKRNRELLAHTPHREICNLSVVFYLDFTSMGNDFEAIRITEELLHGWGQNVENLQDQALDNMVTTGYFCMGLSQMLAGTFTEKDISRILVSREDPLGLHILTNCTHSFGASVILSREVRTALLADFGCELYLLPSSVHELLLLPKEAGIPAGRLCGMVREINAARLQPAEFLSDNVYILKEDGTLEIAG